MTGRVSKHRYRGIVIGGSAGGTVALDALLAGLAPSFGLPLLVVQHLHATDGGAFVRHLERVARLRVAEVVDKCPVEPGCIYAAPADYHMLVERNDTISLSIDGRVNWSRPSIDVLFESAAMAWGCSAVAVILSGANSDGANGIQAIHRAGGFTIAQDPRTAEVPTMPRAAIDTGAIDEILGPGQMAAALIRLGSM